MQVKHLSYNTANASINNSIVRVETHTSPSHTSTLKLLISHAMQETNTFFVKLNDAEKDKNQSDVTKN